jgi:hypothetical protein
MGGWSLQDRRTLWAPRIYTKTNPAGARGWMFRWFFEPCTPAGLVLVYYPGVPKSRWMFDRALAPKFELHKLQPPKTKG